MWLHRGSVRTCICLVLVVAFVLAAAAPAFADSPYTPKVGSKTRKSLMNAARKSDQLGSGTKYKVYELWVYRKWAVGNLQALPEHEKHSRYSFENHIYVWKKKGGKWKVVQHIVGDVGETDQSEEQIRAGYIAMYRKEMKKLGVPKVLRAKLKWK